VKKILLVQLPHPSYEDRNIPLAAGFLKSAAFRAGLHHDFQIDILHSRNAVTGGCARIISEIVRRQPDIVGTSIYLWNAERNSYIFKEVRKRLDNLLVVVGGSEVARDSSYILNDPAYDFFVFGEGENGWVKILQQIKSRSTCFDDIPGIAYRNGATVKVHPLRSPTVDVNQIPSPYLEHFLDPADCGEMVMFTMRGCLQGCSYCSWGARGKLRAFSPERLHEELLLAQEAAYRLGRPITVSVSDSAFNTSPVFWDFCRSAKAINRDGSLDIRCFLQAEKVDDAVAEVLRDAGVATAEIGLQSTDSVVLHNINRQDSIDRFLAGVEVLKRWGFPIVVDTILGLPGDTLSSFRRTLQFTHEHSLQPAIFNLSLGHGSRLRRNADEFRLRCDEHPPFYVYETNTFSRSEIEQVMRENIDSLADADQLADLQFPVSADRTCQTSASETAEQSTDLASEAPVTHVSVYASDMRSSRLQTSLRESLAEQLAANVTWLIRLDPVAVPGDMKWLEPIMLRALEINPFSSWTLFLEGGCADTRKATLEFLLERIPKPASFLPHRDLLFPDDIPIARKRNLSIYAIEPWKDNPILPPSYRLSSVCLNAIDKETLDGLKAVASAGIIIDTGLRLRGEQEIRMFMDSLHPLQKDGKALYFRDWVLHRFWQQNYLRSSPRIISRRETVIRGGMLSYSILGDEDLYLDAILQYGLTTSDTNQTASSEDIIEAALQRVLCDSKRA
jgi:hypothetical protein